LGTLARRSLQWPKPGSANSGLRKSRPSWDCNLCLATQNQPQPVFASRKLPRGVWGKARHTMGTIGRAPLSPIQRFPPWIRPFTNR